MAQPSRARSFAQALGQGAKTDPLDAQVLALYGEVFEVEGQSEQDSASRELTAATFLAYLREPSQGCGKGLTAPSHNPGPT